MVQTPQMLDLTLIQKTWKVREDAEEMAWSEQAMYQEVRKHLHAPF